MLPFPFRPNSATFPPSPLFSTFQTSPMSDRGPEGVGGMKFTTFHFVFFAFLDVRRSVGNYTNFKSFFGDSPLPAKRHLSYSVTLTSLRNMRGTKRRRRRRKRRRRRRRRRRRAPSYPCLSHACYIYEKETPVYMMGKMLSSSSSYSLLLFRRANTRRSGAKKTGQQ